MGIRFTQYRHMSGCRAAPEASSPITAGIVSPPLSISPAWELREKNVTMIDLFTYVLIFPRVLPGLESLHFLCGFNFKEIGRYNVGDRLATCHY